MADPMKSVLITSSVEFSPKQVRRFLIGAALWLIALFCIGAGLAIWVTGG